MTSPLPLSRHPAAGGAFPGAPGDTGTLPAHELIFRHLRDLVLFGELAPGQAVTIQGLCDMLGAGMTPVREALRRLISLGALEFGGNRRVVMPRLDAGALDEILTARQWLEPHLTERATARIKPEELAELRQIDLDLDTAIRNGNLRGYLTMNHAFHHRIYDIAAAPILSDMAANLWLRFGPSLRVVCGRVGTERQTDNHKAVLAAMTQRDPRAAAAAIREDVAQGMETVRITLSSPSDCG